MQLATLQALISKETYIELAIKKKLSQTEIAAKFDIPARLLTKLAFSYGCVEANKQFQELLKTLDTEAFKHDWETTSAKEMCIKYSLATNTYNNICLYLNLQRTKEQRDRLTREAWGRKSSQELESIAIKNKKAKIAKHGSWENYKAVAVSNYKNTCVDKYGVDNVSKVAEVAYKRKCTNIAKYGAISKAHILPDSYTDLFKTLRYDRDASIEYLKANPGLTLIELGKIFNCGYGNAQYWALSLDLQAYIKQQSGTSKYEQEIIDRFPHIAFKRKDRTILKGKELDLYAPSHNLAIEFNGDYWHSTLCLSDKHYHEKKSKLAAEAGIRLIHIYEYEWNDPITRDKIISLINIATGIVSKKIYARDCIIKQISNNEAKPFNDANHIQNHRNAKITYGLFYQDKLVQLMSFSKHRTYQWEIIRGCPGSNNIVIGGVSKLFKHFIREHQADEVFSYCDWNKFNGIGYEKLGMQFIGNTGPDKTWLINDQAVKRSAKRYRQYKEQAQAIIWGAGSKKYLWKKEK